VRAAAEDSVVSRRRQSKTRTVALSQLRPRLSRYLRDAESQPIVITRRGKPAAVLLGIASYDPDTHLPNDPRFLARIQRARASLRLGLGVRLIDLENR
jgi:prevent-host-death family protein